MERDPSSSASIIEQNIKRRHMGMETKPCSLPMRLVAHSVRIIPTHVANGELLAHLSVEIWDGINVPSRIALWIPEIATLV
jgi:hypothetical protein